MGPYRHGFCKISGMKTLLHASLIGLLLLGGCSGRYSVGYQSPEAEKPKHDGHAAGKLHIPPGHLPPPGSCRIWLPGTPPGKQSPPGDCGRLAADVPPGAWLLGRPAGNPDFVEVSIYDDQRPGVVIEVDVYVAATGEFVRRQDGS